LEDCQNAAPGPSLTGCYGSATATKVILQSKRILLFFFFTDDSGSVCYVEEFLELLKLILRVGKASKKLLEEMVKTVAQGMLFKASNNESLPMMIKSSSYVPEHDIFYFQDTETYLSTELIRSFCYEVVRQVPSVSRCLLPTVSAINDSIQSQSTQNFLFEFLSLALSGENTMIGDEGFYSFIFYSFDIFHSFGRFLSC
jgi:hypothetical protein